MTEKYPRLYEEKDDCCGCTACYMICPCKAIVMVADEEGFEYPNIIYEKCVGCYKCLQICPIKNNKN